MVQTMSKFNLKSQKSFRQELRNNATRSERLLWNCLKNSQLMGYKFRRQHGVGKYVLDFYCPELKLAIEIDGPLHETESGRRHDFQRQQFVESLGIRFLRFTDDEVRLDVDGVVERIRGWIQEPPPYPLLAPERTY